MIPLVIGLIGRMIWRVVERKLDGTPNLFWFSLDTDYAKLKEEDWRFLQELFEGNTNIEFQKDNIRRWLDFNESIRAAMTSIVLVLHNSGTRDANNISILLDKLPTSFTISPSVAVHKKETADGSIDLQIGKVRAESQLRITLHGISFLEIRHVASDDGEAKRYSGKVLLAGDYLEERHRSRRRLIDRIVNITIVGASAVSLLYYIFFFEPVPH